MAITGVHTLLYTSEPDAVRDILRDVFGWRFVDEGGGWLIFALPPGRDGRPPRRGPHLRGGTRHQVSLMCDDLAATMADLAARGIEVRGGPDDEGWGVDHDAGAARGAWR